MPTIAEEIAGDPDHSHRAEIGCVPARRAIRARGQAGEREAEAGLRLFLAAESHRDLNHKADNRERSGDNGASSGDADLGRQPDREGGKPEAEGCHPG